MQVTTFDGRRWTPWVPQDKGVTDNADARGFRWIDIKADGPHDRAAADLLTGWGLSPAQVAYALRDNTAGVFEVLDGRIVGTTWVADGQDGTLDEVHFAWDPQVLITVRFAGDRAIDETSSALATAKSNVFDEPTTVLGVVLQLFLSSVNRHVTGLSEDLDDLDSAIIEAAHPNQLTRVRDLRATISPMSRRFEPYADAVSQTLVDPAALPGMDAVGTSHLQSYSVRLGDVVARIGDLSDQLRDCAQDFQTEIGNRQGSRINQLTIVSIVFLPISFLTGYFGMNFQWLDNETMSFATWFVLGVILPICVVLASIVILTNRGYLRRRDDRRRPSGPTRTGT